MKTWQWALIGVGAVAGVVVVAKVLSASNAQAQGFQSAPALPAAAPQVETGAAIATGAFGLANTIVQAVSERSARQDAMAARSLGLKSGLRDITDEHHDPAAALALKQGAA